MKTQLVDTGKLYPLAIKTKKPKTFPKLPPGHCVVCGIDQGEGERLILCFSLESMAELQQEYRAGHATGITWYHTDMFSKT